jgi:hypothetical protein
VATLSTSALAAGAHSITAIHAGDTMYLESTSTAHSQVVQAPTQPPPAPTGVSGTPGDGSVLVTWTAPADDGGSPIIEFVVTASPDGVTCRTTGTSCTVTGLENGTGYTFTVIAINAVGESEESTPSATITPVGPPPPVDSDSDGVADAQDQCPTQAGPAGNNGCPVVAVPPLADSDSDGVPDTQDQCPTQAGPAGNNGCPVPVVAPPDPRASSSTTLTASTTKKVTKKSKVTLTATISPPTATGTVRFSDSGHVLGTATLSGGTATLTVKGIYGGRQALVAEYLGSTQAAGSISAPVVVTVRDTARPVITQLRLRAGAASPTATFVPKDAGGIRAVQVRYRMFEPGTTRLGPWSTIEILPGQARTWTREAVPTRTRMCVSVRAIDYANKYSNWKTKCRLLIGG